MMQFAPESTCMMIASDILAENAPLSLPALRERINTPDGMVNTDLLFSRLIDNGTTPDPPSAGNRSRHGGGERVGERRALGALT